MNIYALLIGINEYHKDAPVTPLIGPINDVQKVKQYLEQKYEPISNCALHIKQLKNEQATRGNIVKNSITHLGNAVVRSNVKVKTAETKLQQKK